MRKRNLALIAGLAGAIAAGMLLSLASSAPLAAHGDADETIYMVEGDVQKPIRKTGAAPVYPEEARKERIQGVVVVRAVIDRQGNVASTEVVESERQDLAAAASDAIGTWTFEPATLEGEPVAVYYHLTVNFRLDGDKAGEAHEADDQEPSLR